MTTVALRGALEREVVQATVAEEATKEKTALINPPPALDTSVEKHETNKSDPKGNDSSEGHQPSGSKTSNITKWHWKGLWAFGSSIAVTPLPSVKPQSQEPFSYTLQEEEPPSRVAPIGLIPEEKNYDSATASGDDREDTVMKDVDETGDGQSKEPTNEAPKQQESDDPPAATTTRESDGKPVEENTKKDSGTGEVTKEDPKNPKKEATTKPETTRETKPTTKDSTVKSTSSPSEKRLDDSTKAGDKDISGPITPNNSNSQTTKTTKSQSPATQSTPLPAVETKPPKPSLPEVTFATVPEGSPTFTEAADKYPDKLCPRSGHWSGYFQNLLVGRSPRHKRTQKVEENFYLCFNATPGPSEQYSFDETPLPPTVNRQTVVLVRGKGENPFGSFEIVGYLDLEHNVLEIQRQYVVVAPTPTRRRVSSVSPRQKTGSSPASGATRKSGRPYFTRKRQPSWKRKSQESFDAVVSTKKRPKSSPTPGTVTATSTTMGPATGGSVKAASVAPQTPVASGAPSGLTPINTSLPVSAPASMAAMRVPKRSSSSGSSRKRSSSVSARSATAKAAAAASSSSSSQYLKLPPVGDPKKARWRAAHFLYYQRHDPELQQSQDDTKSTTSSNASNTNNSNPRYVIYEGEMVESKREGRGVCLYSNGMLYEGEWKRNKEHGKGTLWTADKKRMIYEGDFERGRMQGQGTYYYHDTKVSRTQSPKKDKAGVTETSSTSTAFLCSNPRYSGEFKENMRNGFGKYFLPDGSIYNGMWREGMMNGRGVFTWPENSVYDGEWKDGKRNGQGLLKTSDGFIYDGMWVNNAMEGRGSAIYPNGQTYEGLFFNGRREGRGTMHFTNGAVYEGRFRDDAIDGQGTMKMSKAMVVPKPDDRDKEGKEDFMIPISFQSDMTHIHTKAGFTAIGE